MHVGVKSDIEAAFKEAMRRKDSVRLNAIKLLRNEINLKEKESGGELSDGDIARVVAKQIKQRDDSIAQYREGGREDLAEVEEAEKAVLAEFQPPQLTDQEIGEVLDRIIGETGASSPGEMGKVMKAAMAELGGRADGKKVSEMAKARLS